ncbi:hypothetical protein ABPG75_005686 [Micractinium tetrahymenae]
MQGGGFDFPPMPAPAGQGGTPGLAPQPPRPGTAASGPGLTDPLEGHAVYVSYEEKKEIADRKPGRKSGGHTYVVKFFLCDTHGTEYLAATGEDQGDAHYLYENTSNFPFLRANNKADVRVWLEGIIERSKERAGVHSHRVQDEVPADPNKIHLPKFVGHTHEKLELPDGRHRIEWSLVDEQNDSHLAIVGEEKETRDGHYLYKTQGIFEKALPLQVGNQREVERWLDTMVYHGGVAPVLPAGKVDSQGGAPSLSGLSGHRGTSSRGGGSHARAGSQKKAAGQKHDLLKQATSNQAKKVKTAGAGRPGDPDQEAREAVAGELQKWAQEEAQRREGIKRQALAYATDTLAGKEASAARRCLAALQQATAQPGFLPPPPGSGRAAAAGGSHQQQQNLVDTLGALRELAHMYAPLSLVAMPELKECLGRLKEHQHPEVKRLAAGVLDQWLRIAVAQAQVLTDPRYVEDPRSVLEARLYNREEMDPIVSAVTHRKLHPPPPAKPLLPAGTHHPQHAQHPQQAAAAAERAASRLGVPAAAAAAARADSLTAGDATPGGPLSAHPSTQSLQGLLGAAGGLGAASDAPAASGGGGAAGAALAAQQTVERRRLDLDSLDSPHVVLTSAGMRRRQQQMAVSSSEEEEGDKAAAAGGGTLQDEPSSAPPSSLLGADSHQPPSRGGSGTGLAYAASVDLINAPVSMEESEQAEMLS